MSSNLRRVSPETWRAGDVSPPVARRYRGTSVPRSPLVRELLLDTAARQVAQVLEQVGQRRHELAQVALVQALVRCVGVALRVLDADQQRRSTVEQLGQRTDEADGAATADGGRLLLEAGLHRPQRCLERGPGG